MADTDAEREAGESREARIRERAYAIWMEEGCPDGRQHEHWERAAREIGEEKKLDHSSEASFPASDPPAFTGLSGPRR
ncbi:MAG TPA: DUF2934 domain-containing protein [Acetobacteraceae bacterium]|nr:DUF2934 domain-containing protein [Acetobacteraceae bacterium]